MKNKNLPVTQTPRQEIFEAKRVHANPFNIWTTESFAKLIDKICNDEISAVVQFGHEPPDREEYEDLRRIAIQNVAAFAIPAGNA